MKRKFYLAGMVGLVAVFGLATTPAARADTVDSSTTLMFSTANCNVQVNIDADRNANGGAYTDALVQIDSCSLGIEGGIMAPSGSPFSWGGDVHHVGDHSVTGVIPTNSGNLHGFRVFVNGGWICDWVGFAPESC